MLEAMSAECLLVASNTAPVKEVITDNQNGLLVDFFSPQDIADKVSFALNNPDKMTKIRKEARNTILERYSLEQCLQKQASLIESLVQKTRLTA